MKITKCLGLVFAATLFCAHLAYAASTPAIPTGVYVASSSTFRFALGSPYQYRGQLKFGKVTVVNPPNYKAPKGSSVQIANFQEQVRTACLDMWVRKKSSTGYKVTPGFVIYDELNPAEFGGGDRKLAPLGSVPFKITLNGDWESKGFNSNDPSRKVEAFGGFWDADYNYEVATPATTIKFLGTKVYIACMPPKNVFGTFPKTKDN